MSGFVVAQEIDPVLNYVLRGYVYKGLGRRYSYGRFNTPPKETLAGYGTLEVVEEPTYEEDSYGDQHTGVIIKFTDYNGAEKYYKFDVMMDSYGENASLESEAYEVVPKQVSVTQFQRP